jgi:6-phosphofructokinase 1
MISAEHIIEHSEAYQFWVPTLGQCNVDSPLSDQKFIADNDYIVYPTEMNVIKKLENANIDIPVFEKAGPRQKIFYAPFSVRAAIITCGGLCPGLNNVIKGLVETLTAYGVDDIFGIPYGYMGLNPEFNLKPIRLNADMVDTIHYEGGSIFGSSRGEQSVEEMVKHLQNLKVNILFTIGGDGTLKGASGIAEEILRRGLEISIVGIPKTIDNDLQFVGRTFGFETAVYKTMDIITSAHVEANSAFNGLGLVKLMGRDSGFIAAHATLANPVVNFCLIPELEFQLEGENGLLKALERRFEKKKHAVVVVAEGAGQHLFKNLPESKDASGNTLKHDIGTYLAKRINEHFSSIGKPLALKYFDPSYSIRSVPAQGTDAIFCNMLAQNAVHAAMAGKTNVVIGRWNQTYIHVPIPMATRTRQTMDLKDPEWRSVISCTRQDRYFLPK